MVSEVMINEKTNADSVSVWAGGTSGDAGDPRPDGEGPSGAGERNHAACPGKDDFCAAGGRTGGADETAGVPCPGGAGGDANFFSRGGAESAGRGGPYLWVSQAGVREASPGCGMYPGQLLPGLSGGSCFSASSFSFEICEFILTKFITTKATSGPKIIPIIPKK